MRRVVLTHAARTPIGKFLGQFQDLTAVDLGARAVSGVLERAGVDGSEVDEVIMGCARQAGLGPNPARQVAIAAGIAQEAPASTTNMACGSGLLSIIQAARMVAGGEADCVVAGGMESMTKVPFLLPKARLGYRMGHQPMVDAMYQDGFACPMAGQLMGETAEALAKRYEISRDEQDTFAARSQNRAESSMADGRFTDEIVPVTVTDRKGKETVYDTDEHPRAGVTAAALGKLAPVFDVEEGTVTAGNSSGITDGAAAVLVMSEDAASDRGFAPLAGLEAWQASGVDPKFMGLGPVPATRRLMERTERSLDEYALIELNEAFAAQVISCDRELGLDPDRLNVNGGSIALGHPIGATGCRIVVTLLHEMRRRGAARGLASLCISGGQGLAVSFEGAS
ncbi:MAG: acetyl-CoA C-acetyltransferase [Planctomycetes bacterium]|nr:acetyl-CoA C-acetyltransferase [Planctomycetota bacterium]